MPEPLTITMHPTAQLVLVDDRLVRLWEGTTAGGLAVKVLVHAVAARDDADDAELARALTAIPSPLAPGQELR